MDSLAARGFWSTLPTAQSCAGRDVMDLASGSFSRQDLPRGWNPSCSGETGKLKGRGDCESHSSGAHVMAASILAAEALRKWHKSRRRKSWKQQVLTAGVISMSVGKSMATPRSQALECAADSMVSEFGEEGFWSIVIPTYNRLPILTKCLEALEEQEGWEAAGVKGYEVIVVDDGSTDATVDNLEARQGDLPHVRLLRHHHAGATAARNSGVAASRGAEVVFIDSDLVVTPSFLATHARALARARARDRDDRAFTYGRVVNTSNFDDPRAECFKITVETRDGHAILHTSHLYQPDERKGNVAISKRRLMAAGRLLGGDDPGPFDADFSEYGWEDLELGERLRQGGATIEQCPEAVGYHWHPAFSLDQLPRLIDQERQRGRNGVRFYQKHPNLNVRLMIQMTPFHRGLWFALTLGGLLNERSLEPVLRALVDAGKPGLAAGLLSPVLNWHTVQAVTAEAAKSLKSSN